MSFDRKRKLKVCKAFPDNTAAGAVVRSRTGRTRAKCFVVVSFEMDRHGKAFALVADGDKYSLKSPKRKSVCHLEYLAAGVGAVNTDEEVRRILADIQELEGSNCPRMM